MINTIMISNDGEDRNTNSSSDRPLRVCTEDYFQTPLRLTLNPPVPKKKFNGRVQSCPLKWIQAEKFRSYSTSFQRQDITSPEKFSSWLSQLIFDSFRDMHSFELAKSLVDSGVRKISCVHRDFYGEPIDILQKCEIVFDSSCTSSDLVPSLVERIMHFGSSFVYVGIRKIPSTTSYSCLIDLFDISGRGIWGKAIFCLPNGVRIPYGFELLSMASLGDLESIPVSIPQMGILPKNLASLFGIDDLSSSLEDASDMLSGAINQHSANMEILKSSLKETQCEMAHYIKVGSLCLGLSLVFEGHFFDQPSHLGGGIAILSGLALYETVKYLKKPVPEKGVSLPENGDDIEVSMLDLFKTSISDLFPSLKDIVWSSKIIVSVNNFRKSGGELLEYIFKKVDELFSWIFQVAPFRTYFPYLVGYDKAFSELFNRIENFISRIKLGTETTTVNDYEEAVLLLQLVDEAIVNANRASPRYSLLQTFRNNLRDLQNALLSTSPNLSSTRIEPTTILLNGTPNSYKSEIGRRLCADLQIYLKEQDKLQTLPSIFQMQGNLEYFEGYQTGTGIMYWDEFGQVRDAVGITNSEFLTLIKLVNKVPYSLNMAFGQKGTVFCNTRFLVTTSNLKNFDSIQSIIDRGAVDRRFHQQITVVPRQDIRDSDGGVDWDKVRLKYGEVGLAAAAPPSDAFQYFIVESVGSGKQLGREVTYEYMLNQLKAGYQMRKSIHEQAISYTRFEDFELQMIPLSPLTQEEEKLIPPIEMMVEKGKDEKFIYSYLLSKVPWATAGFKWESFKILDTLRDMKSRYMFKMRSSLEQCSKSIKDFPDPRDLTLLKELKPYKLAIGGLLSLIPLYKLYKYATAPKTSDPQSIETPKATIKVSGLKELATLRSAPQMGFGSDRNGYELGQKILRRNQFTLYWQEERTSLKLTKSGFGTVVHGHIMLIPLHFKTKYEARLRDFPESVVYFCREYSGSVDIRAIYVSDLIGDFIPVKSSFKKDICFLKISPSWGTFTSLLPYLKENVDLNGISKYNSIVLLNYETVPSSGTTGHSTWNSRPGSGSFVPLVRVAHQGGDKYWEKGIQYELQTEEGDCGSIAFDMNPKIQKKKILGFHISGDKNGTGYTQLFTYEDIIPYMEEFPITQSEMGHATGLLSNGLDCTGVAPHSSSTYAKSSFVKSPWYREFTIPFLEPSRLGIKNMIENVSPYDLPSFSPIPRKQIKDIVFEYTEYLHSVSAKFVPPVVLTFEQAIFGLEGYELPQVNRTSSPGFKYKPLCKQKGRFDFFGSEPVFSLTTDLAQRLRIDVDSLLEKCKKGERPHAPFTLNLKDELRKVGKPARIFGAGELDYFVATVMYFGTVIGWFHANRITNHSTLGINVYSKEWDTLANYLNKNLYLVCGDFKQFDLSEHPEIVWELLHIIESFYPNASIEDRRIRKILFIDVVKCHYVYGDSFYTTKAGLPSGHLLTAFVNTLLSAILIIYSIQRILGKIGYVSVREILSGVSLETNGDDSAVSVPLDLVDLVCEENIAVVLAEIGFTYTSDSKDGTFHKGRKLSEVNYLKRSFLFNEDYRIYIAPLEINRLLEFTNYTRKVDGMAIFRANIEKFLTELSAHGREVYNNWGPKVIERYVQTWGVYPPYHTYDSNLRRFTSFDVNMSLDILGTTPTCVSLTPLKTNMSSKANEINLQDCVVPSFINEPCVSIKYGEDTLEKLPVSYSEMNEEVAVDAVFVSEEMEVMKGEWKLGTDTDGDVQAGIVQSELKRFLSRPILFLTGVLSSTDTASTFAGFHYWEDPLNETILKDKMKGVFSIKADLRIRIVHNANTHQQGIYKLAWLSTGGSYPNSYQTSWFNMHRASIQQVVQLPGIIFNLNSSSENEFVIPWSGALSAFPYSSTATHWGTPGGFFLYPIVPLNSASGSTTASFTIWTSYENIVLGSVSYPQMGLSDIQIPGMDLLTKEQEKPLSSGLKAGATLVRCINTVVPWKILKLPLQGLAYASDVASNVAFAFGFSKPTLVQNPVRMVTGSFIGSSSCDFPNPIEPTSLSFGNHVTLDQGDGSNPDELEISYFCGRMGYHSKLSWADTDAAGTVLATIQVNPGYYTTTTDSTVTLRHYTPLGLVNNWFQHWRGDIEFTFDVACTGLHSGRFEISFEPYIDGIWTASATTLSLSNYLLKGIVDIRETSQISFRVPFVSPTPWLNSAKLTGVVRIMVLDKLVAPAVVPSSVTILVRVRGCENIEFNAPRAGSFVPIVPSAYQSGTKEISFPHPLVSPDQITHGQRVTSLRQLVKRAMPVQAAVVPGAVNTLYTLAPFSNFWYYCTGAALSGTNITVTRDLYSTLCAVFALSRGGLVFRPIVLENLSSTQQVYMVDYVDSGASTLTTWVSNGAYTPAKTLWKQSALGTVFSNEYTPSQGFLIPQHTRTLSRINCNNSFNATNGLTYSAMLTDGTQLLSNQFGSGYTDIAYTREGADDVNFLCFVSIPPVYEDTAPA